MWRRRDGCRTPAAGRSSRRIRSAGGEYLSSDQSRTIVKAGPDWFRVADRSCCLSAGAYPSRSEARRSSAPWHVAAGLEAAACTVARRSPPSCRSAARLGSCTVHDQPAAFPAQGVDAFVASELNLADLALKHEPSATRGHHVDGMITARPVQRVFRRAPACSGGTWHVRPGCAWPTIAARPAGVRRADELLDLLQRRRCAVASGLPRDHEASGPGRRRGGPAALRRE